jgi:hypothetical protein
MSKAPTLAEVALREQDGRDSFARYRAQVRAAAIASLALLEAKGVDRVYCDLHDDYVVRSTTEAGVRYRFVQVKTKAKQNENWTIGELLGIDGRVKDLSKHTADQIRQSFVGKLLAHTVLFGENCEQVIFQTNNHLDAKASALSDNLREPTFSDKYLKLLVEKFNDSFVKKGISALSNEEVRAAIGKLFFDTDVSHIKLKNVEFDSAVRKKIFQYSEIHLTPTELDQILLKLLDLVSEKSSGVLEEVTDETIDAFASIGIGDLLDVLAISRPAYELLKAGADNKAVKSASLIQRVLGDAAKDPETVEYCSRCKIRWDDWQRQARKNINPLGMARVTDEIAEILDENLDWKGRVKLSRIMEPLQDLTSKLQGDPIFANLDADMLLGGFFSEFIKRQT